MYLRIIKAISAIAIALICTVALASCSTVQSEKRVYDNAELLSEADEQRITEEAKNAKNSSFFVVTHNAEYFGDSFVGIDFLREQGFADNNNIVIFVVTVDRGAYHYDFYTYGTADNRISNSQANEILDSPDVSAVSAGDIVNGSIAFIKHANSAAAFPTLTVVIVAVVVGLVAGGVTCGVAVAKYKMKLRPTNYPLDKYARLELTESHDSFINSRVSVQIISNGSDTNGGGSSHGGGGGHRGGR